MRLLDEVLDAAQVNRPQVAEIIHDIGEDVTTEAAEVVNGGSHLYSPRLAFDDGGGSTKAVGELPTLRLRFGIVDAVGRADTKRIDNFPDHHVHRLEGWGLFGWLGGLVHLFFLSCSGACIMPGQRLTCKLHIPLNRTR